MYKLAIIGSPVYHTKSPDVYAAIFSRCGGGTFTVLETPSLENIREKTAGYDAIAVTMPHKAGIIPYLDGIDPEAAKLESVNFVVIKDNKFTGYSTDGAGFISGLAAAGFCACDKQILIYGCGGAAGAVCSALQSEGAHVSVCGRNSGRISAFSERFSCRMDILENAPRYDAFINATPLGMTGCEQFSDFSFLDGATSDYAVFDLVYSPTQTRLLQYAASRGMLTQNGAVMLKEQACAAFRILTER